jgi:two-component system, OmpR family, sensor kinase
MRWRTLGALVPAFVGIAIAMLFNGGLLPNRFVNFRGVDLSWVAVLIGFIVSFLVTSGIAMRGWEEQRYGRIVDSRHRFLGRLDHELRNRLTAVQAGLARLQDAHFEDDQQEAFESVQGQIERLSKMAAGLSKLADIETRRIEPAPVNVADLLDEIRDVAQGNPKADDRNLIFHRPEIWSLPDISGDRDLLFLALYNLLDNAIKYTRSGDTIEVWASKDGPYVVVRVTDTGPGIPENEKPHVWEELYRGEGSQAITGNGLGLALVKAIVTCHKGKVTLDSNIEQDSALTTPDKKISRTDIIMWLPIGRSIE